MLLYVAYMLLSFIVSNAQYQMSVRTRVYKKLSPGTQWVSKKKWSLLAEKLCSEFVHLKQIIINF